MEFINKIDNYINLNPTGQTIDNYPVYEFQQIESATLQGVELNLHYHPHFLHQLHFEQAYTFIKATDNNNTGLALIPSNKIELLCLIDSQPIFGRYYGNSSTRAKCKICLWDIHIPHQHIRGFVVGSETSSLSKRHTEHIETQNIHTQHTHSLHTNTHTQTYKHRHT